MISLFKMPSVYTDPRDFVALKRIPSPSHVGLKITTRCSSPVYTCEKPSRKEVARENYERRKYQMTQCGYKSLNYKPYKSVGEVFLDDKELILKALGQIDLENEEQVQDGMSYTSSTELDRISEDFISEEENVTIKEEKSENLQTLNKMLYKGRETLNKVRLGISLFKVIEEERKKKIEESEKQKLEEEENAKKCMRPANENQDDAYDDDKIDITRFVVQSPTRTLIQEDSSDEEQFLQYDELEQKPSSLCVGDDLKTSNINSRRSSSNSSDVSRRIVTARWQRIGSMVSQLSIDRFRRMRKEKYETKEDIDYQNQIDNIKCKMIHPDNGPSSNHNDNLNTEFSEDENDNERLKALKENSSTARSKISRSKKYKNDVPRPFSPIFTNINFYETESREYTFRQLCAIHWILEAMSQDQQPSTMPPISTCWKLKDLKEDMRSAQKRVEKEKVVDPIWRSFLTNPNKFSKGRTGRRGTLLQRRVSVAPSVLRLLSASSSGTTATTPFGIKSTLSNDGQISDSGLIRERSETTTRSRSSTQVVMFAPSSCDDDDYDLQDNQTAIKKLPTQKQVNPLLATFKEKAYTVRDVVVAKNAFNRRGSKMIRSKSTPGDHPRRKSTVKLNIKDEMNCNVEEQQEIDKKSPMYKDGVTSKERFIASAISAYGAISINKKVEKIPAQSKEKFEELSKENALILHDNLESRERTNVESMEKKFLSLNVMSDVNKAITVMRSKSALKVETDEEKKARFSEECSWYKNLLENLPSFIRANQNNALVLDKIAKFGSLEGRKISTAQFLRVLSLLRPWELCFPDISAAIEFVRDKVVKMDKREFEDWFQARISKHRK